MSEKTESKNKTEDKIKEPVPLSTMVKGGTSFEAQGKKYKVLPLKLKEVDDIAEDRIFLFDNHVFNILNKQNRKKLDAWISGKLLDSDGGATSLEKIMGDDWDVNDLKEFMKVLLGISG
jgi:hypothetical protein